MGDVIDLNRSTKNGVCCDCGGPSTHIVKLTDIDSGADAGVKYFCDDCDRNPNVIPVNLPDIPALGFGSEEQGVTGMDVDAFLNMRDWVRRAVEAKGARFTGGGYGCGECDLDIELQGHHYNIRIKPLKR